MLWSVAHHCWLAGRRRRLLLLIQSVINRFAARAAEQIAALDLPALIEIYYHATRRSSSGDTGEFTHRLVCVSLPLLLQRIACTAQMRPIAVDGVAWSVCWA